MPQPESIINPGLRYEPSFDDWHRQRCSRNRSAIADRSEGAPFFSFFHVLHFFIFHFFHFSLIFHLKIFIFLHVFTFFHFFVFFMFFLPLGLPKNIAFYYEDLDFKARIWVREERKKERKKKRTKKNAPTPSPSTIARTGPFCYSRAWKPLLGGCTCIGDLH